jgi:hypothetical protein
MEWATKGLRPREGKLLSIVGGDGEHEPLGALVFPVFDIDLGDDEPKLRLPEFLLKILHPCSTLIEFK